MKTLSPLVSLVLLSGLACAASQSSIEPNELELVTRGQPAVAAADTGVINGVVKDTRTGEALENAIVVLQCTCLPEQREAMTNARGIYSFAGLPAGNYSVMVLAGQAQVTKTTQLPRGAKFRANFSVDPSKQQVIEIVVEAAPVASSTAQSMTIGMEQAKNLPVGANTSRDFTAVVDISPTASRDAAGITMAGTSGAPSRRSESYAEISENQARRTKDAAISTFSIDVDTASYSNVRRFLTEGQLPPVDAVRSEELINYFSYDYVPPRGSSPFSVTSEVADCPWNKGARLLHVGLQGQEIAAQQLPRRNLVFLLDVSGSMNSPDKLPLLRRAMKLLASTLTPRDRVSIVVYAGASGVVLEPTSGADQHEIMAALDRLSAGGSTNGAAAIEHAYALARRNFDPKGINRVILATDGDFNVGATSDAALETLIEHERGSGVFLSVLGLGTGNLQDAKMELLADKGNGNYAYIDTIAEARKVLVEEGGATLVTVAKDVKIQVEFDPKQVSSYRLIGYENRVLATQDFADDRKDAGEIGAGHSVTALYEFVPARRPKAGKAIAELRLRHKAPMGTKSRLSTVALHDRGTSLNKSSDDFRFAAAVAEFSMLLRGSSHAGSSSWRATRKLAAGALGLDPGNYRHAFLDLVVRADALAHGRKP